MNGNKKGKQSILWKFMEKFALTFFSFLCSMILARLLTPQDYGNYAVISSLVLIGSTLVTNNIINLIVKEQECTQQKINSIYFYNILLSLFIVLCFALVSGVFYVFGQNGFASLLLIQSFSILILAVQSVFMAILIKRMKYKIIALAALISGLISFAVAIVLAQLQFGVYALVAQYMVNHLLLAISLACVSKQKITWITEWDYVKVNLSFMFSVILADVIHLLSRAFQNILVQKTSSTTVLGFYDKGYTLGRTCSDLFYETANTVTFPLLSESQQDNDKMKSIMKSVLYSFTCICIPLIYFFFLLGDEIIILLFSATWIDSTFYFQFFFLTYCVVSLNTVLSQLLVLKNEVKKYRNCTLFFQVVAILVMCFTYQMGARSIPIVLLVATISNYLVTLFFTKQLVGFGLFDYLESCKYLYIFVIICVLHSSFFLVGSSVILKLICCLIYLLLYIVLLWKIDRKQVQTIVQVLFKK